MQKISIILDVERKIFKIWVDKEYLFWKWNQANPNPKLNPRVTVGVNSWENEKRSEPET